MKVQSWGGGTFWFRGDSGFPRLDVEGRWADSLASDCEGLADRLALYFPCCLGFREAGGGDCRGQFRGCNLDLNNAIISFRLLKNNTALHNKKKEHYDLSMELVPKYFFNSGKFSMTASKYLISNTDRAWFCWTCAGEDLAVAVSASSLLSQPPGDTQLMRHPAILKRGTLKG